MVCINCSKDKDESMFPKRDVDGRCKACRHAAAQRVWAEKNKDYIKTRHKEVKKRYQKTPKGKATVGRKNSKRRYMIANQSVSEDALQQEKQFRLSMTECANCKTTERLSLDHITPLSKGGLHSPDNWQCLCIPCNSAKRNLFV